MATVLKIIYDEDELASILTTAVEGGIGYWSYVCDSERDPDLTWKGVLLEPTEEGEGDFAPTWVRSSELNEAVDLIVSGTIPLRQDIVDSIRSGDTGNIDSDGADCIVQIAMFGKVVYG